MYWKWERSESKPTPKCSCRIFADVVHSFSYLVKYLLPNWIRNLYETLTNKLIHRTFTCCLFVVGKSLKIYSITHLDGSCYNVVLKRPHKINSYNGCWFSCDICSWWYNTSIDNFWKCGFLCHVKNQQKHVSTVLRSADCGTYCFYYPRFGDGPNPGRTYYRRKKFLYIGFKRLLNLKYSFCN